jgi:hypothetical protein
LVLPFHEHTEEYVIPNKDYFNNNVSIPSSNSALEHPIFYMYATGFGNEATIGNFEINAVVDYVPKTGTRDLLNPQYTQSSLATRNFIRELFAMYPWV